MARKRTSERTQKALRVVSESRPGRATRELLNGLLEGDVVRAASAMAFDLFLAAVPLLALAGWVFAQLVQDGSALHAASLLLGSTPEAVQALSQGQLARFDPATVAPVALAGALWLSSSAAATGMALLESSGGSRPRAWWHRRLIAIVLVIIGTVVFGLGGAFALMVSGGPRRLAEALGDSEVAVSTAHILGLCLIYLLATALLAAFFRIAVKRPCVRRRRIWPGAFLGTGLVALTSTGFSFYATRIARFALYYGSLAAVAVTLLWLWLVCLFVLIGAELNFVLEGNEPAPESSGPVSTRVRFGSNSQRPMQTPQPSGNSAEP